MLSNYVVSIVNVWFFMVKVKNLLMEKYSS